MTDVLSSSESDAMIFLCNLADIPEDEGLKVEIDGHEPIAVFQVDDEVYAIDDLCTHGLASLAEGMLDGHAIECPFHSGTFDIRTGEALTFPCTIAVRAHKVHVEDGRVFLLPA